jgi:hypothetical protein
LDIDLLKQLLEGWEKVGSKSWLHGKKMIFGERRIGLRAEFGRLRQGFTDFFKVEKEPLGVGACAEADVCPGISREGSSERTGTASLERGLRAGK